MRGKYTRFNRALRNYMVEMGFQSLVTDISYEDQMVMEYIRAGTPQELYQSYAFRSMFFSRVEHHNMRHEIYKH